MCPKSQMWNTVTITEKNCQGQFQIHQGQIILLCTGLTSYYSWCKPLQRKTYCNLFFIIIGLGYFLGDLWETGEWDEGG